MRTITSFIFLAFISLTACQEVKQPQKSTSMKNLKTVETFLEGFNDPSKIGTSLALLSDDYTFTNPMVSLNSKTEFIALAQEIGKVVTGVKIIQIAENGDWVGVQYIFTSTIPGVESNLASEWFRIENGQIKESTLIYDASKWQAVYAQMKK